MNRPCRIYVVASTGGSVLRACLQNELVRRNIAAVITDRKCGALDVASDYFIKSICYEVNSAHVFSEMLLDLFRKENPDLIILFYTKLLKRPLIDEFYGRIVNFHPSLLPAFPGLRGFDDSVEFGSKFIGSTSHLVFHDVDAGFPIQQAAFANNPSSSSEERRHIIFLSQCAMLVQLIDWIERGKYYIRPQDGRPVIADCSYGDFCFSPKLECSDALSFYEQILRM